MAILVDKNTKLITQGITGKAGLFHTIRCRDYGTSVVGGVNPRKAGTEIEGFPVFGSVKNAVEKTGANTTMIFVPAPYAADAIIEAADAGIQLIVAITEGIPVRDMLNVHEYLKKSDSILVGPNCPGITTAGVAKIGIAPGFIHQKGKVGIVSRSGTLTYEAVHQTTLTGLGQTTAVGIGGDPIHGLNHLDVIKMFENDPETEGIVLIGEIGGTDEEEAAEYIKSNVSKPVAAFIAGASAPKGKRMGHAGAIISGGKGTAASKIKALEDAGVMVALTAADIGHQMCLALRERTGRCHCNKVDDCKY
ncbi:MAG: succinate--CoA ligase subunit alpha [Prolixibacteraceae bacterium]|jgi:succinyl-CoA synthetase alpha subunit|nr:succinate--CoA ligase subunit alpha [Prolixibacteraceae bacterium]